MLVYLHGFNSSPASHKARLMQSHLEGRGLGHLYACPALPDTPREAIRVIENALAGRDPRAVTFLGSSLGGFYATYLAEKLDCRAVLLNPASRAMRIEPTSARRRTCIRAPYECAAHLEAARLWASAYDPERSSSARTGDEDSTGAQRRQVRVSAYG